MAEVWIIVIETDGREGDAIDQRHVERHRLFEPTAEVLGNHLAALIRHYRADIWASERATISLSREEQPERAELAAADDDKPMRVGGALQAPEGHRSC